MKKIVVFGILSLALMGACSKDEKEGGQGRAALGLYPADGQLVSFPGPDGAVENFVLLPYGQGDPDKVASDPHIGNNYFGAASLFHGRPMREPFLLPGHSVPASAHAKRAAPFRRAWEQPSITVKLQ